jgi:hypothetical protein
MVFCKSSHVSSFRLRDFFQGSGRTSTDFDPDGPANIRRVLWGILAVFSILGSHAGSAVAVDSGLPTQSPQMPNEQVVQKTASPLPSAQPANEELTQKLELMEKRMRSLEVQLKKKDEEAQKSQAASPAASPVQGKDAAKRTARSGPWWANSPDLQAASPAIGPAALPPAPAPNPAPSKPILDMIDSPVAGLSIGAYGELKYGFQQNPLANGQWQNGFDASRVVLLPTYQITPNIIFNAEIEFEHAGSGFDADDKLHGTAEIEQVWIDFKIVDSFNIRAPGIDLIPIGYINEHHEPTQFYSVNRPELYNGLLPSTWKAPATSVYGTIADGWNYQVQASSSLEDFGDDFSKRGDNNKVLPGPYAAGIDGQNALGFALPVRGDFKQLSNVVAVAAKLDYSPPSIPGFSGSTSAYYSPNTTPRGAHASIFDPANPATPLDGAALGNSSLTMIDSEFRYRVPDTGLELRGEGVYVTFGNPANLRANNDTDPTNNVGKSMYGASGEIAYHIPLGTFMSSDWEGVTFYRYTYENLQTGGFAGTDANLPNGSGQLQFHTAGFAVFPSPKVVLKASYQHVIDGEQGGAKSDSVLGGVGFFF